MRFHLGWPERSRRRLATVLLSLGVLSIPPAILARASGHRSPASHPRATKSSSGGSRSTGAGAHASGGTRTTRSYSPRSGPETRSYSPRTSPEIRAPRVEPSPRVHSSERAPAARATPSIPRSSSRLPEIRSPRSAATPSVHSSAVPGIARTPSGHIERSTAAKDAFQRSNPCPSTGATSGGCKGFVIDHVKPLASGGADRPENMQWQTEGDGKTKDAVERNAP